MSLFIKDTGGAPSVEEAVNNDNGIVDFRDVSAGLGLPLLQKFFSVVIAGVATKDENMLVRSTVQGYKKAYG